MVLMDEVMQYVESHRQEAYELLLELARIPAPSNHEEKRAAFCKEWLEKQGAQGVMIDDALNVIYPIGCSADGPVTVYMAHSDVVFPDTELLPLEVKDGRIYCPGVGDDTANAVALLMTAKYLAETKKLPVDGGVLLVINSGEEGLGNLKGSRKIVEQYGSRIQEFISLDGTCLSCANKAVGSRRYRVAIDTEGGHSYSSFGNRNAIAYLASLIDTLYTIKVPPVGKTTYNVGTISGGTSVNTIAQHAEMLYEFRSDERDALAVMEEHFQAAIAFYRTKGIGVTVELVGDRPCMGEVDPQKEQALMERVSAAVERHVHAAPVFRSGSTDCNIPLSMGIPSVCAGCYDGAGAHTREEYVEIDSLLPGLKIAFELVLAHF